MQLIIAGQSGKFDVIQCNIHTIVYDGFTIFVGRFGFGHIPSQPGSHTLKINTWKVATHNLVDSLKIRFNTGGYTVSKSDLVYSGVDR